MPLEIPVKGQDHWYRYIFSRDTSNYNDESIFFFRGGGTFGFVLVSVQVRVSAIKAKN